MYKVIKVKPGPIVTNKLDGTYRTIDLNNLSDEDAERLVKNGFPYLKKVKPAPNRSKAE